MSKKADFNSFHADYGTVTSVKIICKFAYLKRMNVFFSENTAGSQRLEHVEY